MTNDFSYSSYSIDQKKSTNRDDKPALATWIDLQARTKKNAKQTEYLSSQPK